MYIKGEKLSVCLNAWFALWIIASTGNVPMAHSYDTTPSVKASTPIKIRKILQFQHSYKNIKKQGLTLSKRFLQEHATEGVQTSIPGPSAVHYGNRLVKRHLDQVSFLLQTESMHLNDSPDAAMEDLHLDLHLNDHLFHPQFQVFNPQGSNEHIEHCYYHGTVNGHHDSFAAVSSCDGALVGVLKYQGNEYHLAPSGHTYSNQTTRLFKRNTDSGHELISANTQASNDTTAHETSRCGVEGNDVDVMMVKSVTPSDTLASGEKSYNQFVKILFCNDKARVDQLGSNLETNTLQLANIVSRKYQASVSGFGYNIFVVVAGIYNDINGIWRANEEGRADVSPLLGEFTQWRKAQLLAQENADNVLGRNDVALMLSGRVFTDQGKTGTIGLAYVGTMCTQHKSAGVIQALGNVNQVRFETQANTVAHELGHVLSMPHDGMGAAEDCPKRGAIMEPTSCVDCPASVDFLFSDCSTRITKNFLDSNRALCLNADPFRPYRCGNGVVDEAEGEQCDVGPNGDDSCCDMTTCRFRATGIQCSAKDNDGRNGLCQTGTCIVTCGNNRVDSFEDCDPSAGSDSDCCDSRTCRYAPSETGCQNSGKCNGIGICKTNPLGTLVPPNIDVQEVIPLKEYRVVAFIGKNRDTGQNVTLLYTLDGSTPSPSSSRTMTYKEPISISLEDVKQASSDYDTQAQKELTPLNPFLSSKKSPNLYMTLTMKAIHEDYLSSPNEVRTVTYSLNADLINALRAKETATLIGVCVAVAMVSLLSIFFIYRIWLAKNPERHEPTRRWGRKFNEATGLAALGAFLHSTANSGLKKIGIENKTAIYKQKLKEMNMAAPAPSASPSMTEVPAGSDATDNAPAAAIKESNQIVTTNNNIAELSVVPSEPVVDSANESHTKSMPMTTSLAAAPSSNEQPSTKLPSGNLASTELPYVKPASTNLPTTRVANPDEPTSTSTNELKDLMDLMDKTFDGIIEETSRQTTQFNQSSTALTSEQSKSNINWLNKWNPFK